jgi:hypothetical protein
MVLPSMRKRDVNDRVPAVFYAVRNGWIEIGPKAYAARSVPSGWGRPPPSA